MGSENEEWSDLVPQWVVRLVNNLGVYIVFFSIGYYVLNYVKSQPEPEPSDPSFLSRWKRFLFFGPGVEPLSTTTNTTTDSPHSQTHKNNNTATKDNTTTTEKATGQLNKTSEVETMFQTGVRLVFCVLGLLATFLSWGLLQERIMTTKYDTGYFTSANFTVLCSRACGWVIALVVIKFTAQPPMRAPFYQFSFTSVSNVLSSYCQLEALKYLSFPTQVLGKSSKMIPVMIMGKVLNNKKYPLYEYGVAIVIIVGVAAFMMSEQRESEVKSSSSTSIAGLVLLTGYLTFDSFTSQWQDYLFHEHKLTSYQMMLGVNSFSASLTMLSLLQSGELFSSIAFVANNPECLQHLILFSITGATGSMFIFYTIKHFGPLVFTMIMVTRQLIAIVLSCIFYGHRIDSSGIVGVAIVFIAIAYRMYRKNQSK